MPRRLQASTDVFEELASGLTLPENETRIEVSLFQEQDKNDTVLNMETTNTLN